jgi:hypothetical protein
MPAAAANVLPLADGPRPPAPIANRTPAPPPIRPSAPPPAARTPSEVMVLHAAYGNAALARAATIGLVASVPMMPVAVAIPDAMRAPFVSRRPMRPEPEAATPAGSATGTQPVTAAAAPAAMAGPAAPLRAPTGRDGERTAGRPPQVPASVTAGARPAGVGGETEAGEPRHAAARNPRQALASTIGAVRHRATIAHRHPRPDIPVANAEAAGTDPNLTAMRAADHQTVKNVDAAAQQSEEIKPTFRSKLEETLTKAINDNMKEPKTKSEADDLMEKGAKQANQSLGEQLATQRNAAVEPVESAVAHPAEAAPSAQSSPKLNPEQAGPPPVPVPAAPAVPAPLPAEQLDYSSDRAPTDQAMAENDVSKEQLEEGNEPAFGPTLSARSAAEKHEATATARYRQSEAKVQAGAQDAAHQALAHGIASVHGARSSQIGRVDEEQLSTKSKNEQAKQAITNRISEIKKHTLDEVKNTLNGLEKTATQIFENGLRRAEEMYDDAFKEAKGGAWTWVTTWGSSWKRHIENSLATAKGVYEKEVKRTIGEVADFVEGKLAAAKRCVADGLRQVETFVNGLHGSEKEFATSALKEVSGDFEQMVSDIDSRADQLIDKLTEQYRASYQRMQAMEEKLREENKSLWERVYDATVGLIKKIIAFKDMLLDILGRAASVIGDIIRHPIRFLGNLIDAVKLGINNFVSRIAEHLKQGFMEWLFGEVAAAGIQLPKSFDLKGIVNLVLQVLGVTYANFRARAVALLGEKVVGGIEKVAEVFKRVATEGPGALWEWIKEKLGDLQSMVIDQIQQYIIGKVIIAGITWLIGLLNPASAFFKACKAIYDIIMFFIEHGSQIVALVNAVIDSMAAIATGAIGGAAAMLENALARAIPVVIGFLAALLGIGGLSDKIKSVIESVRKPINAAIDWVIGKAVTLVSKARQAITGLFKREDKQEHPDDPGKQAKLDAGVHALVAATHEASKDGRIDKRHAKQIAATAKKDHPVFKSIEVVDGGESWDYEYKASDNNVKGGAKGFDFETVNRAKVNAYWILLGEHGDPSKDVKQAARTIERKRIIEAPETDKHLITVGAAIRENVVTKKMSGPLTITIDVPGIGKYPVTYFGGTNVFVHGIGSYAEIEMKFNEHLAELRDLKATRSELLEILRDPRRNPERRRELERASPGLTNFLTRFKILREVSEIVRSRTQLVNVALSSEPGATVASITIEQPLSPGRAATTAARAEAVATGEPDPAKRQPTMPPRPGTLTAERYKEFVDKTLNQLKRELPKHPELSAYDEELLTAYFVAKAAEFLGRTR